MSERVARLESLLRRVLEWTPALPAESGLLDEIAAALQDEPSASPAEAFARLREATGDALDGVDAMSAEPSRDARGFPLAKPGIPIEARCAACGLPMVSTDGEYFTHDCDCMHRGVVNRESEVMKIGESMAADRAAEAAAEAEWQLGEYTGDACPNCGRQRVCLCPNGKRRCEKCNWSPELGDYAPVRL